MATKHICDRCGAICKPKKLFSNSHGTEIVLNYELTWYGPGQRSYDLCYNCAQDLVKFMNDPRPMHIPKMEEEVNAEN